MIKTLSYLTYVTSFSAASSQPGAPNSLSYTVVYTDSVTLKCPDVSNSIARPSWGRIVHGHKVGISQCYDNAFNCSISGGVVNEAGLRLLGHEDSGLYFCRDFERGDEYYLNLTILGIIIINVLRLQKGSYYITASVIPRPLPCFRCYTQKTLETWERPGDRANYSSRC